jgi:four helix bundle protein
MEAFMSSIYKDLIVWQRAIDLVEKIYQITRRFPHEELYGLVSQLRRAAVSIASNIAEGQGRMSPGEFRQFVGHARGSALEVETQLIIAARLGFVDAATSAPALKDCDEIKRMLHGLALSLEKETTVSLSC